jgi:UDP-N-acetylmuramoylalanine-D-glutamate ligase
MQEFTGKRTLVVGLDPSGQAACRLLRSLGSKVAAVGSEHAEAGKDDLAELAGLGVEVRKVEKQ